MAHDTISFLITTACQNRCRFCFERGSARQRELPLEFVLDKVGQRRPKAVDLAGGEPLLHRRFREMARGIKRMGARLTVTTNGLALADEDLTDFLVEAADRIVLSVHAATPTAYAQVTGNPNGFSLLEQAVDNLSRRASAGQVLVNTTVTASTLEDLAAVPGLISPLRPAAWHVTNPMPIGAAAQHYDRIAPRIADVRRCIDAVAHAARDENLPLFFGFFPSCALGRYRDHNSDLIEPSQASGFHIDFDLNPHQTEDLVFERVFPRPCSDCSLAETGCAGVAARYVQVFGTDELSPVDTAIPEKA